MVKKLKNIFYYIIYFITNIIYKRYNKHIENLILLVGMFKIAFTEF